MQYVAACSFAFNQETLANAPKPVASDQLHLQYPMKLPTVAALAAVDVMERDINMHPSPASGGTEADTAALHFASLVEEFSGFRQQLELWNQAVIAYLTSPPTPQDTDTVVQHKVWLAFSEAAGASGFVFLHLEGLIREGETVARHYDVFASLKDGQIEIKSKTKTNE